jgi:hypothetical protein
MYNLSDTRWIEELANKLTLRVAPGSMIDRLVQPYRNLEAVNIEELVSLVNADEKHEGLIDELSSALANIMMQRSSYFRNEVASSIEHVFNLVSNAVTMEAAPTFAISPVRMSPPLAFSGINLETILGQYIGKDLPHIVTTLEWPTLTETELMSGLNSAFGQEALDEVNSLIAASPVSIETLYNKVFLQNKGLNYPAPLDTVAPTNVMFQGIEAALSLFLVNTFMTGAFDETVRGTTDELLIETDRIGITQSVVLNRVLSSITREDTSQLVAIEKVVINGKRSVVFSPTKYDAIITSGGKELLMGLSILGNAMDLSNLRGFYNDSGEFTIEDSLRVKALDTYAMAFSAAKSAFIINEAAKVRSALIRVVVESINDGTIELPENLSAEAARALARAEIQNISVTSREALYPAVRSLMCRSIFKDTGALEFLTLLDDLGAKQIGETPNEVATLAAIQLYARWGHNQLEM